jgi:hypothetical protein
MGAHGGERRYSSYSFLTSALDGSQWSASRPGRALPPGKEPPVPIVQEAGWAPEPVWTQRLEEKSCLCRRSNQGRPVRSQSLYSLSYPGSSTVRFAYLSSLMFFNCTIGAVTRDLASTLTQTVRLLVVCGNQRGLSPISREQTQTRLC